MRVTIVAVVAEASPGGMAARAAAALGQGADMVEFRLDHMAFGELEAAPALAREFGPRAIATLRSAEEGGRSAVDKGKRARALREFAAMGFAMVDAELGQDEPYLDKLRALAEERGTTLLVSSHPPAGVGPALVESQLRRACQLGHMGKVAVPVEDTAEAMDLMHLAADLRVEGLECALIALGPAGQLSRVRGQSALNYVVAPGANAVAPGQLTLRQALAAGRPDHLLLGLLGHPLGHSLSPLIHGAALEALEIPGLYVPLDIPPNRLEDFVAEVPSLKMGGFNVTIPHKETIIPHLDALDPTAEELGAVNTVAVEGGSLMGYNTDPHGFMMLLQESDLRVEGRRALVVGAGGGARAVVMALQRRGAQVAIAARTASRAEAFARDFPGVALAGDVVAEGPWDAVVNCTPVGMAGHEEGLPVPPEVLGPSVAAVDLVYNPRETSFLREARRRGARAVGGMAMLVHQGAMAFEIWTGRAPPLDTMRRAAEVMV